MDRAPSPWRLALARLEGALPFLAPEVADALAQRSLRRLWRTHVEAYPFESLGLEHNPGVGAGELMRSWYAAERRDFLSWISRRAPPPLARAAQIGLAAKGLTESFAAAYGPAERALARLDALLPAADPLAALATLVAALRQDEPDFLEGGSEVHLFAGRAFDRPPPRGAAWAASLALAMRPQLFALGAAPLAFAALAPRRVFRAEPEAPVATLLAAAIGEAIAGVQEDLSAVRCALARADTPLAHLYASSRAPGAWRLLVGLGPLTRAEVARALGVTKRTASQAAQALASVGLIASPRPDGPLLTELENRQV